MPKNYEGDTTAPSPHARQRRLDGQQQQRDHAKTKRYTELASKSRSRNLSSADQSWIASRRKTTTTPAKPARATAIWDAVLSASPGSMDYHFNIRRRSGEEYFSKRIPSFVVLLRRRFKL